MENELDIIPQLQMDTFVSLSELKRTEEKRDSWSLYFQVPDGEYPLTVSFPQLGGVHVHGLVPGYFSEPDEETVTYTHEKGMTVAKAANGISARLHRDGKWKLEFCRKDGSVFFVLDADALRLGYLKNEVKKIQFEGEIQDGERLAGFGERYNTLNQVGRQLPLSNKDTGYHGLGEDGAKSHAYKNVPLFHSSLGYTFFFNSFYAAIADLTLREQHAYQLDFNGPTCDFYVWNGTVMETLDSYTKLTGRPVLPPKWAFQFWAGAGEPCWICEGKENYLKVLQDCLDGYKKLGTMPSALYGEGIVSRSDDSYSVLDKLDVRMLGWSNPTIDFLGTVGLNYQNMQKFLPDIELSKLPSPYELGDSSKFADQYNVDFSNPAAFDLLKAFYAHSIKTGLKGVMVDYGEYIAEGLSFYNGMNGDEMHNFYAYVYNKTVHDVFADQLGNNFVLFARAGCAGSHHWAASFGGDQAAQFFGLRQAYLGGLNASVCGFSVWGSDIGSLCCETTEELYIRWLQFATFSPLMRTHGNHNPWNFGKRAEAVFLKFYWLRENFLDYIYHSAILSHHNGMPIMQMMMAAFPDQKPLSAVENQYMFGTEILVCPVLTEGTVKRPVTLPEGSWIDFWTAEKCTGGRVIEADAPIEQCPFYLREGSVLPLRLASTLQLGDALDNTSIVNALLITPALARRKHTVWFDDADSFRFTIERTENGCTLLNEDGYKTQTIVMYGAKILSAQMDGEPVTNISCQKPGQGNVSVLSLPNQLWWTLSVVF